MRLNPDDPDRHSHALAAGIDAIEINVDEGDVDAQRFYERHGYSSVEPDSNERAFYYFQELRPPSCTNLPTTGIGIPVRGPLEEVLITSVFAASATSAPTPA